MTIRTFWTILIKILGIWLVIDSITVIYQFLSTLPFVGQLYQNDIIIALLSLALLLVAIGFYFFLVRLFIFRTGWFIDKLKLDKDFEDEKLDLTVQRATILNIATIVIGGLLFIEALPQLCKQIFSLFQTPQLFRESPTAPWIVFYCVKTITGYLLMVHSKVVVKFIEQHAAKDTVE